MSRPSEEPVRGKTISDEEWKELDQHAATLADKVTWWAKGLDERKKSRDN